MDTVLLYTEENVIQCHPQVGHFQQTKPEVQGSSTFYPVRHALTTTWPFLPAVQREANQLVEEFMLLANMSVAKIVADAFPERALLRRHPPPEEKKLAAVLDLAKDLVCLLSSIAALHSSVDLVCVWA